MRKNKIRGISAAMLRLLSRQVHKSNFKRSFTTGLWGDPPTQEVELTVDGIAVSVPVGTTIMQACGVAGVDVPRFCYHERLKIAGNCRMCLVQVNGGPKLVASCAAPVAGKMSIVTGNEVVKRAREGVMEFLLANHPLDCPICDQGGECDLQEQAMAFGSDRSRFLLEKEDKRAVEDKAFGPLVKTSMNRCIHCTRCVRFANDVAGVDDLGTTGRGNEMQIGTYIEKMLDSELSGNIIDLCPVGALTSKPYAFTARPWELKRTESIDVMDAVGANILIDVRGQEVMRILPRLKEDVNEEWLGDKSRFAYDGLKYQRLTNPLARIDGQQLEEVSWEEALLLAAERIRAFGGDEIEVVAGPFVDLESLVVAKDLFSRLGCPNLRFENDAWMPVDIQASFRLNCSLAGIEEADRILIVGANPRKEAPLIGARIRKAYLAGTDVAYLGQEMGEFPFATQRVCSVEEALKFFEGSKKPLLLVGESVFEAEAFDELSPLIKAVVSPAWNGFAYLPLNASRIGALEIGWKALKKRSESPSPKLVYLLNADGHKNIPSDAFVIYQGHHGDHGASRADLILPGAAYTEKNCTFVNLEGRAQRSRAALAPPVEAREDWQVLAAVGEVCGLGLAYGSVGGIYERLGEVAPGLVENLGWIGPCSTSSLIPAQLSHLSGGVASRRLEGLKSRISDYYMTDCISRASPTMAKCSLTFSRPH